MFLLHELLGWLNSPNLSVLFPDVRIKCDYKRETYTFMLKFIPKFPKNTMTTPTRQAAFPALDRLNPFSLPSRLRKAADPLP